MVDATSPRCSAATKDGKPCAAKPRPGTDRCPWHAPELAGKRSEWSARGGRGKASDARARKALPAGVLTIDQLRGVLGHTIARTLAGTIEPNVATAVGSLARAYGSLTEAAKAEELAARLDDLEAAARRGGAA